MVTRHFDVHKPRHGGPTATTRAACSCGELFVDTRSRPAAAVEPTSDGIDQSTSDVAGSMPFAGSTEDLAEDAG